MAAKKRNSGQIYSGQTLAAKINSGSLPCPLIYGWRKNYVAIGKTPLLLNIEKIRLKTP